MCASGGGAAAWSFGWLAADLSVCLVTQLPIILFKCLDIYYLMF